MWITKQEQSLASCFTVTNNGEARMGFSLLELLIVMAIVGLLLALTDPGMLNMGPSRKGAAMEMSGFLERARSKAVSSEKEVFIAFANGNHPVKSLRFRSFAFFMEEVDIDPSIALATRPLRQTSEWLELPEGMIFGNASYFDTETDYPIRTIHDLENVRSFSIQIASGSTSVVEFPYLVFAPSGQVLVPSFADADGLNLAILEGTVSEGGSELQTLDSENGNGELLQISFYTGRANILTD